MALNMRYSLLTVTCSLLAMGCVVVLLACDLNGSLLYSGQRCALRRPFG